MVEQHGFRCKTSGKQGAIMDKVMMEQEPFAGMWNLQLALLGKSRTRTGHEDVKLCLYRR